MKTKSEIPSTAFKDRMTSKEKKRLEGGMVAKIVLNRMGRPSPLELFNFSGDYRFLQNMGNYEIRESEAPDPVAYFLEYLRAEFSEKENAYE